MIQPYQPIALTKTAHAFFGIGMLGIGLQHFMYSDFRPVILPPWPQWAHNPIAAYIIGAAIILAGIFILFGIRTKTVSLLLAGFLLLCFVFVQCPYVLFIQPNSPRHLGLWTDPLKELALSGGAFIMAGLSPYTPPDDRLPAFLEKIIPAGKIFFSITLIAFGLDHFYYTDFVATLVPSWIPGHIFWTYFAGVALIGSGAGFIFNFTRKPVALLAAVMIFLWFVLLHIPRAIADPYGNKGNEITSVFEALAFSGMALGIAIMPKKKIIK
jgi:uncharacterized membrane protein